MIERERYVPQRVRQLSRLLTEMSWEDDGDAELFDAFSRLVSALYHFEFHDREQEIVELWESMEDRPEAASRFTSELSGLLDGANYDPLTTNDLKKALDEESLLKIKLHVDLDEYDELMVYRRGTHVDTVEIRQWRGLRKAKQREIHIDERVVVHTRIKPADWFEQHDIDPSGENLVPGHISLKQFVDVPRADIEMLLPSARVRFRAVDQLVVGVPALLTGLLVIFTKLLPTFGLLFLFAGYWLRIRDDEPKFNQATLVLLLTGFITLGVFVARQLTKLKNRRMEFWKTLTENLYFRTLGNGVGVLHDLLASAEEQEVVEVLLGYRFLLDTPAGMTIDELDRRVEDWLSQSCSRDIDFEVHDAAEKLRRLGVVTGESRLVAMPLEASLVHLDDRWDSLFEHTVDSAGRDVVVPADESSPLIRLLRIVDRFRSRLERQTAREPTKTP